MGTANFPGRPFRLRDNTWVVRQEVANNRSLIGFEMWIDKLSYSPTWSAGQADRVYYIDGAQRAANFSPGFDFQGAGPWLILNGQTWVGHNANGTKTMQVQADAVYDLLGGASIQYPMGLPTIPRNPPPAPSPVRLDQITRTSMRYVFSSNGDGGTPISRWESQLSTHPSFNSANGWVSGVIQGPSPVTRTGLRAGTEYFWRSRGVNAAGTGAWSAIISATTLSGAWISVAGAWVPAEVLISQGGAWVPGDVVISQGGAWRPTG